MMAGLKPHTITITTPPTPSPSDDPYSPLAGTSRTAQVFFSHKQTRVKLADGTYALASAVVRCDASVVINEPDTVTYDGKAYKVMATDERRGFGGEAIGCLVYLE
jgi:hypothetical protein